MTLIQKLVLAFLFGYVTGQPVTNALMKLGLSFDISLLIALIVFFFVGFFVGIDL